MSLSVPLFPDDLRAIADLIEKAGKVFDDSEGGSFGSHFYNINLIVERPGCEADPVGRISYYDGNLGFWPLEAQIKEAS